MRLPWAGHDHVSIHAPTRGATVGRGRDQDAPLCFNPRAHAGRDTQCIEPPFSPVAFQSTRPRGARRPSSTRRQRTRMFQSTRPRGARHAREGPLLAMLPFQSTRPRGARRHNYELAARMPWFQSTRPRGARPDPAARRRASAAVSIHAPTRGATHRLRAPDFPGRVSIHAPTRGATVGRNTVPGATYKFQSTRPRGARQDPDEVFAEIEDVSIHAPTRGATRERPAAAGSG